LQFLHKRKLRVGQRPAVAEGAARYRRLPQCVRHRGSDSRAAAAQVTSVIIRQAAGVVPVTAARAADRLRIGQHATRAGARVAGSTGLEPAASGVTGASPESRSFAPSRFSSGIRTIVRHGMPSTDTERHRSALETGTPTGTVPWLGGRQSLEHKRALAGPVREQPTRVLGEQP
jgi:hypothetical protein